MSSQSRQINMKKKRKKMSAPQGRNKIVIPHLNYFGLRVHL